MSVITFDQITPEWLTEVLTRHGDLTAGKVLGIEQQRDPNPMTHNATLHIAYSPGAQGSQPARLFFKQNRESAETKFYQHIAPTLSEVALLTCYDAQYDDSNSHLLLQHVDQTHFTPPDAVPMPLLYCEMIVDALGDRLSAERLQRYEGILAAFPRYRPNGPKTLVHGDSHWWNFLYPNDPAAHPLYLIDWAVWNVNLGVSDIAYTIALQCYPERRARIEQPLVRRYHDRLLRDGIREYDWEQCWEDYRRMVVDHCLWPILWQQCGLSPNIWWFALECTMAAFEGLHCEELLDVPSQSVAS
jgi:hypothetical protein